MKCIRMIQLALTEMLSLKKIIVMIASLITLIITKVLLYKDNIDLLYMCFSGPISLYIPDILSWIFFQMILVSIFGLFLFNHMNIRIVYILQKIDNIIVWLKSMMYSIVILIFLYYLVAFILAYIARFMIFGDIIIIDYLELLSIVTINIIISFTIISINLLVSIVNNKFHLNIIIIVIILFCFIIIGFLQYDIARISPIWYIRHLNKNKTNIFDALTVTITPLPIIWILISLFIKRNIFKIMSRGITR